MISKTVLLSYNQKINYKRYQELMAAFSSLEEVWEANLVGLKNLPWPENFKEEFLLWKQEIDPLKIETDLKNNDVQTIEIKSAEYPSWLKKIYDPPICLFVKGKLFPEKNLLAVVGSRKNTVYGKQITESLVEKLVASEIGIASGLALGIDGIAHDCALRSGGYTVAVLGGGVDKQYLYPRQHLPLAEKIISSGGAIISEYPPKFLPTQYSFPKRNRIIAGLSLGTLIIEATAESGALITAEYANDNGREVFAVPQNINSSTAAGPNNLIKQGAHPVTDVNDILDILNLPKQISTKSKPTGDSPQENIILNFLGSEPIHINNIIKGTNLPSPEVTSNLTILEIKGKIKNLGNMMYVIK